MQLAEIAAIDKKMAELADKDEKNAQAKEEIFMMLNMEIKNLESQIANNQEALDQATAIRQQQLAEFNAEEKGLVESISAMKAAVTVLSKHQGSSFLQMTQSRLMVVTATVQHAMQRHGTFLKGVFTLSLRRAAASSIQAP